MSNTDRLRKEISNYLAAHNSMTLATCAGGKPWAAAVFYVYDSRFRLYFLSDGATSHGRDVEANPEAAATINDDPKLWREIKGVQLEGRVKVVRSPVEKARALALYLARFPFVRDFIPSPLKTLSQMAISGKAFPVTVYRLTPVRLFFLDNARGFSHREELPLA